MAISSDKNLFLFYKNKKNTKEIILRNKYQHVSRFNKLYNSSSQNNATFESESQVSTQAFHPELGLFYQAPNDNKFLPRNL